MTPGSIPKGTGVGCNGLEGILYKLASMAAFALMQIVAKMLYVTVPAITPLEVLYFRGVFIVFMNMIQAHYVKVNLMAIPRDLYRSTILRSLTGTIDSVLFFTSTKLFPLSLVTVLQYLSPVMTALLGFLFLREGLTRYDITSMLLAFTGVMVIMLNPYKTSSPSKHYDVKWYYYFCPLMSPLVGAVNALIMRSMGKGMHFIVAPTYLGLTIGSISPIILFGLLSYKGTMTEYTPEVFGFLFALGITGWLGQIFISRAMQIEKAARIQALNYFNIVYMIAADMALFGTTIHWLDFVGIFIVVLSNGLVAILRALKYIE